MNRLANEKSPYLLQHKNNPVDWYSWGEEAFKKAKKEDKPIFLSIGYATCHWCHVMEHESFEDETVANLMNRAFVNIKVDREERPDIDNTYMTVCQMLTGTGGWPLTIIMTPDKEPFYAATYIPKHPYSNRIGMTDLVPALEKAWKEDRERVSGSADRIKEGFAKSLELGRSTAPLSKSIIQDGRSSLEQRFDREHGGFGGAPKFPSPHNLLFLKDHSLLHNDALSSEMTEQTLTSMRLGGLWDHVGNGFHRYSTDEQWLLPHFEKMLYDQALLLHAYAEGWDLTGNPLFRKTAFEIAEYIEEHLTSPDGAFYSAEDADSEGEEGKFYVWTKKEIESILAPDDAELFCERFQVEPEGNFRDEAAHQKTGANILHLSHPLPGELVPRVDKILSVLRKEREKRVRPLLDDKILTDWNGLMISALARAGVLLNNEGLIKKAEKTWGVLSNHCLQPEGKLLHRLKEGEAAIKGMADDYAFSIWGLIELYSATFNPEYLEKALTLQNAFDLEFYDKKHGGYYFTSEDAEQLLGRQKEIYDGAVPSSNSVTAFNCFRLSRLTGNMEFDLKARSIFKAFSEPLNDAPSGYAFSLKVLQLMENSSNEIIITCDTANETAREAIQICRKKSPPGSAILFKTREHENQLNRVSGFCKNYPVKKELSVFVCSGFACKAPVHTLKDLSALFSE